MTFSENGTSVTSGDTFAVGHHAIVASAKDAADNTGQTQLQLRRGRHHRARGHGECADVHRGNLGIRRVGHVHRLGHRCGGRDRSGDVQRERLARGVGRHVLDRASHDRRIRHGCGRQHRRDEFSFDVVDTTPPAVTAALVHDTGASSSDRVTSNATISGTGDANTVVTLKEGVTLLGTTIADGTGAWSFTPTLTDGVHTITARETDKSGNTGSASLTLHPRHQAADGQGGAFDRHRQFDQRWNHQHHHDLRRGRSQRSGDTYGERDHPGHHHRERRRWLEFHAHADGRPAHYHRQRDGYRRQHRFGVRSPSPSIPRRLL